MADFPLTRSYFFPRLTPMYHPFFYEPGPSLLTSSFFDIDDAISRMHETAARQMVEVFKDFDPLLPPATRQRRADWMDVDDDEFFKDIEPPFSQQGEEETPEGKGETMKEAAAEPEPAPGEAAQQGQQREAQAQQEQKPETQQVSMQPQHEPRTLSTRYVYSSTTVRDEKGEPIVREFKHYEDSTGRAKTFRRRAIGDKSIPEVYQKFPDQEKVERKVLGNMKENELQDFEKKWQETPFGKLKQEDIEGGKGQQKQHQLEGHKQEGKPHQQPHHQSHKEKKKETAKMEL